MSQKLKRSLLLATLVILGLAIASYIYLESRDFLHGPEIMVTRPQNKSVIYDPAVEIEGKTKRIAAIELNDSPISIDNEGNFKEKLFLKNGYNVVKLVGWDRFKKQKEVILELVATSTTLSTN